MKVTLLAAGFALIASINALALPQMDETSVKSDYTAMPENVDLATDINVDSVSTDDNLPIDDDYDNDGWEDDQPIPYGNGTIVEGDDDDARKGRGGSNGNGGGTGGGPHHGHGIGGHNGGNNGGNGGSAGTGDGRPPKNYHPYGKKDVTNTYVPIKKANIKDERTNTAKCGSNFYKQKQISSMMELAGSIMYKQGYVGHNQYPHQFFNHGNKISFNKNCKGKMWEYPITPGKIPWKGKGSPKTDRLVFTYGGVGSNGLLKMTHCGMMYHNQQGQSSFIACDDV